MAKKVYESARLFLNGYKVAKWANSLSIDIEQESAEVKTFESDGWMELARGGRSSSLSYEGFILTGEDRIHQDISLAEGVWIDFVACPDGDVVGSECLYQGGLNSSYGLEWSTDDAGTLSVDLDGSGPAYAGSVMLSEDDFVADGDTASFDLGVGGATGGVLVVVQCLDINGSTKSLDITLEDSLDDSTFSSIGTFSTLTNVGARVLRVNTAVDRYIRLSLDLGADTTGATIQASVYNL